jgi:acyl carrier protein phosphodiesterase
MNYLAHALLSFNQPQILLGNMISDFVKGRKKFAYPVNVQHGIQLHRDIDTFTDAHSATAKAKEIFRPHYRLYSGAIVDVVYDYFLANDETIFPSDSLYSFTSSVYEQLEEQNNWLPQPFLYMLPYMKRDNWLYNYRTKEGIGKSLAGLVRRAAYLTESATAFGLLNQHEEKLAACYYQFFPDVKQMAKARLEELLL